MVGQGSCGIVKLAFKPGIFTDDLSCTLLDSLYSNYLCLVQGVVGQGSYGIVKLAYNEEDDKNYAMKILR